MNENQGPNKQLETVPPPAAPHDISSREMYGPPPGYGMDYSPEGEAHLRDYWRSVRRHLWLILTIAPAVSQLPVRVIP